MMRFQLLAASTVVIGFVVGSGPASSQEYPYCSSGGTGAGQSCSFETMAQCNAAAQNLGVYCYNNPRYTAPVAVAPAPQAPPTPPPAPKKKRTTAPSATKS